MQSFQQNASGRAQSSSEANSIQNGEPDSGSRATKSKRSPSSQASEQSSLTSSSSASQDEARLSSSADYDHIRNTTLMFFLDRLFLASKEGKEARTLHELSCLFGTKEFSKEMRQIVGASRNGLKKFLQAYPSLFTIDGDKVYLSQLSEQTSGQTSRDYNKEAVDYFKQKLLQFGASLVPIKNLFGYRSQASQEVRHVSGKNAKEFRLFLSQHVDVFELVADEHVVLKSALTDRHQLASLQPISLSVQDDLVSVDPYLNKQFALVLETCLRELLEREEGPEEVSVERLYETIKQECKNESFLKMVKTIEDFRVFLRTHPRIFKRDRCPIQGHETVALYSSKDQQQPQQEPLSSSGAFSTNSLQQPIVSCQQPTLKRSDTNATQSSDKQLSLSHVAYSGNQIAAELVCEANNNHYNNHDEQTATTTTPTSKTNGNNPLKQHKHREPSSSDASTEVSRASRKSPPSPPSPPPPNQSSRQQSQLRASAPPFVPKLRPTSCSKSSSNSTDSDHQQVILISHANNRQQSPAAATLQRSKSNLNSTVGLVDPRHSLRSYLIKATANNSSNGLYSPSKLSNGAASYSTQQAQSAAPLLRQSSALNKEELRARTVDVVREASNIISRIMTTTDAVAFDCKGYNLDFNGQITLIQFAFLPNANAESPSSTSILAADRRSQREVNGALKQLNGQQEQLKSLASFLKPHQQQHQPQQPVEKHLQSDSTESNANCVKQKPEVCIFDLITNPELAYCLKPLLESEQVVKIVHDVRSKSCALYTQFGIMLNRVFDTQVANLVIQQQETGKPAYKSRYISMSKLCEVYGDEDLIKYRNLIRSKTRHSGNNQISTSSSNGGPSSCKIKDANYWRQRPLTQSMVYESTMDVYCLVGGVYQNLKGQIKAEYQPLFDQLNLEGVLARIKPDEIKSVKKERKIDLEVIDLKQKLYAETTASIVLSNREVRLLRHIDLTEEVRNKIQQCKKVAKKLERLDMKSAQNAQLVGQSHNSETESNSFDPTNPSLVTNASESSTSGSADPASLASAGTCPSTTNHGENGHLEETVLPNLMDSSMFDELKDKMIESSSLLKSLDDDIDDINDIAAGLHGVGSKGVDIAIQCDLLN